MAKEIEVNVNAPVTREVTAPVTIPDPIEVGITVDMQDSANVQRAEAWAVGTRHGTPVSSEDPTYHNNSKYYAEEAAAQVAEINNASAKIDNMDAETTTLGVGEDATVTVTEVGGHKHLAFGIPQGPQGVTGATGPVGATGPKGDRGDAFHIVKTYPTIADMNADFGGTDVQTGEYVMIVSGVEDPDNAKVYIKGDLAYGFVVDMSGSAGIQGPRGETGPAGPRGETGIQGPVGETGPAGPAGPAGPTGETGSQGPRGETGPAGATGAKGDPGETPNFSIGIVQTLLPGEQATASITGTPENPVLNLSIPKGDTGTAENIYGNTLEMSELDSTKVSEAIAEKAGKVANATSGNFAGLDANGNITDSGSKASDFLTSHQDITGKADKVANPTSGNFAGIDYNGNLTDSGHSASDFLTATDIAGKTDKVVNASAGNFAGLDINGNLTDSGSKASDFATTQALLGKVNVAQGSENAGKILGINAQGNVEPVEDGSGDVYGNTIPMSSSDSTTVAAAIGGKTDKVSNATNGNFAALDANGNLTDSGHKHSDYLTSHQDITGKADKVTGATGGNFAGLDANGNLTDSGSKASDFATTQALSGKVNVAQGSENAGMVLGINAQGNVVPVPGGGGGSGTVTALEVNGETLTPDPNGVIYFGDNQLASNYVYDEHSGSTAIHAILNGELLMWKNQIYAAIKNIQQNDVLKDVDEPQGSANIVRIPVGGLNELARRISNKGDGTVTGVKKNGTTISPDSNGVVDIGSIINPAHIAFNETGDTSAHIISEGQYVFWNNILYTASADINIGDTFSYQSLAPVPMRGIANELLRKIDEGGGGGGGDSQVWEDVAFSIAVADWTLDSVNEVYTATVYESSLTNTAGVFVMWDESFRAAVTDDIYTEKSTGYVTFTTATIPADTVTGTLRIIDSVNGTIAVNRGGTGAQSAPGARANLNVSRRSIEVTLNPISVENSALNDTTTDSRINAAMQVDRYVASNPEIFKDDITFTPGEGTLTITCSSVDGSSTMKVYMTEAETVIPEGESYEIPATIEAVYNNLNDKIGDLTELKTTEDSSLVGAVNDLYDQKIKVQYGTQSITINGNADQTVTLTGVPSVYSSIQAIMFIGYTPATTWGTTLLAVGVSHDNKSISFRTNGSTNQSYTIRYYIFYR